MSRVARALAVVRGPAALALSSGAAALLAACAGSVAPQPTAPPVELVVAAPEPAATVVPWASSSASATAEVAAPPPAPPEPPQGMAPPLDVSVAAAPAHAFGGAAGNTPGGITSIWGAGSHVFVAGPGMILRSEDHGLHFTHSAGPKGWPSVWGASVDEVYVAGDQVVRSTDRGKTWVAGGPLPGHVYGIWGSGPDEVYVVGGATRPFLARSTDHGATWSELPTPVSSGWFYGVTGTGPRQLLVVGQETASPGASPSAVLLLSTDSGGHFKRLPPFPPIPSEPEVSESRAACFTRKGLFATTTYGLRFTPDLGRTWKMATSVGTEALALACRGDAVIVGGRNRKLSVSGDGGRTWQIDPLGALWTAQSWNSVQAAFVGEKGEAFVGFEALYDRSGRGSLFRRAP
jgi:hypothetical protein